MYNRTGVYLESAVSILGPKVYWLESWPQCGNAFRFWSILNSADRSWRSRPIGTRCGITPQETAVPRPWRGGGGTHASNAILWTISTRFGLKERGRKSTSKSCWQAQSGWKTQRNNVKFYREKKTKNLYEGGPNKHHTCLVVTYFVVWNTPSMSQSSINCTCTELEFEVNRRSA